MKKITLSFIFIAIAIVNVNAQVSYCSGNWIRNGTVRDDTVTTNCYIMQITADCFNTAPYDFVAGQVGSMWCDQTINICTTDFNYCWDITTGSDPFQTGDGFTFTLQSSGTSAIGGANANIGYGGIAGNVFAVEFDPYDNAGANDDGPCGATTDCTIGFQFDNNFEHDGSYVDSEGFPHNEWDVDQHTCCTASDYGWDVANTTCSRCDVPGENAASYRACFDFNATTEMFTVTVDGSVVLGPSKVDLAVILGTCNVYYGLTTACGGQETYNESCEVVPMLDLKINNINAEYLDDKVSLTWNLSENKNNVGYFVVQRSSDQIHWKNIGEIDAINYHLVDVGYNFEFNDNDIDFNSKYYRIVQYNTERKIDLFSNVAEVEFPNIDLPFTYTQNGNSAEIFFNNKLNSDIYVSVYSTTGKLIVSDNFSENAHSLLLNGLSSGIYIVSTSTKNNTPTFDKIILK